MHPDTCNLLTAAHKISHNPTHGFDPCSDLEQSFTSPVLLQHGFPHMVDQQPQNSLRTLKNLYEKGVFASLSVKYNLTNSLFLIPSGKALACNYFKQSPSDHLHLFWMCPRLTSFWSDLFKTLEQALMGSLMVSG